MQGVWKNLFLYFAIGFLAFIPILSLAQNTPVASGSIPTCDPTKEICNPINVNSLNDFIKVILEGIVKIGIPIIALAIIYSGFLFVTAQGNSEKLTKAKDALLFSVVGAALVLGAWALAQLISETVLAL